MTSLKKTVLGCLGVAIASSLTLAYSPASAQSKPQQEKAAALGGPLTPSNPALFQAQAEPTDSSIKLEEKEKALQSGNTSMDWQSEHLDEQRQFDSNFSIINVDLN
ncbi:hypothetical protein C1752_03694 [Acaryochloris thomasi RCC1774]|uniref:Uncharacterized protein n=1 Tax=Acaryochloris thomasi RCC1774 TaxID=1764569 RepID=A0A2W1JUN1_9CYAN|nr:hypothetical protein [Acaryochloris thomasi]PZD72511.1 hypothetical protein C1752_03694 [Acaryochloris thomasi RCC1774]